jgi:putative ABC transport system ATP-binding protein
MMADSSIRVDSVVVDYVTQRGTVRALNGVSFKIEAGSSVAITGPSGCGKSTLLGLLAGLALPSEGEVRIGSRMISSLSDRERSDLRRQQLGLMYQADNLLPFLTVLENVSLQLALQGGPTDQDRPLELLAMLGLEHAAQRLPDELSGGQRQRVAVARAVVHRPNVILADEPTGALDAGNARAVIELLLATSHDLGASLVIVTHDRESAMLTDRAITLLDGALTGPMARHHVV